MYRETNSYSCHGAPNVSNTAGAAIWTLDYTLFASTINIERVFFHEGIGYKYNLASFFRRDLQFHRLIFSPSDPTRNTKHLNAQR